MTGAKHWPDSIFDSICVEEFRVIDGPLPFCNGTQMTITYLAGTGSPVLVIEGSDRTYRLESISKERIK